MGMRRLKIDIPRLRDLWSRDLTIVQIAAELGLMELDIVRAARALELPDRRAFAEPEISHSPDPTLFEIEQRCAEIQSRWTKASFHLRAVGRTSARWSPPLLRAPGNRR